MRVMIATTHLLGTGHLVRALTLARAFRAAGHSVLVASGGAPVAHLDTAGIDLVQLPPLCSDGANFSRLLTPEGTVADAAWLDARKAALVDAFTRFRPAVLITELFPFGRRSLKAEFVALLQAARDAAPRPLVLASVRDILAPPSKPGRVAETEALVAEFYDAVLVHSDPARTPLEVSWPVSDFLQGRLRYTGYVAPPAPSGHPSGLGRGEILVTTGGGAVAEAVYEAAIAAAAASPGRHWRLLVGGAQPAARIARLQALADADPGAAGRVTIEPARPEFRQMLCHAAASVSLTGYNTALDLLATGTPGVLVPFDAEAEVEQGIRAESLARSPHFAVVPSAALNARTLLAALDLVLAAGRFRPDPQSLDGASRSVAIAEALASGA
jgi:predicted glycosyltransferase